MKRRILSALLAALLVVSAAGCGSTDVKPVSPDVGGDASKAESMESEPVAEGQAEEEPGNEAEAQESTAPEESDLETAGPGEETSEMSDEKETDEEEAVPEEEPSEATAPAGETGEEPSEAPQSMIPEEMTLSRAACLSSTAFPNEENYIGEDGTFDEEAYEAAAAQWTEAMLEKNSRLEGIDRTGVFSFTEAIMPKLLADGENCAASPVNIYMALAMLAEVSGGATRDQVLEVLGEESIESLRENAEKLYLAVYNDDDSGTAVLGDAVWLRNDSDYKAEALENLAKYYYASAYEGVMGDPAYDEALRTWLNEQTGGLLKDQAQGLSFSPETVLALTSSVYFKGGWSREFAQEATHPAIFHGESGDAEVSFMTESEDQTYFKGETFGAVCKPFNQGAMYFILPDEGVSPAEVLADGEYMELFTDVETIPNKYLTVNVSVPKFDISSDLEVSKVIKELGAGLVFDAALSDFTSICDDPLFVSAIRHAARVKIDEEGCEAAAYTAIMMEGTAFFEDMEEMDFVCDRPFIFVVTGGWNLPLFVGVVNNPA